MAAALDHVTPDRCPWQATFTPEFAERLRADLRIDVAAGAHNPHGGGNPYDLEMVLDQDVLITSVGWANSYYGEGSEYVDEWGVGWLSVPYETPYGVGHYTEPCGHPLADADVSSRVTCHPTRAGPSSTLTPGGSLLSMELTTGSSDLLSQRSSRRHGR